MASIKELLLGLPKDGNCQSVSAYLKVSTILYEPSCKPNLASCVESTKLTKEAYVAGVMFLFNVPPGDDASVGPSNIPAMFVALVIEKRSACLY